MLQLRALRRLQGVQHLQQSSKGGDARGLRAQIVALRVHQTVGKPDPEITRGLLFTVEYFLLCVPFVIYVEDLEH